MELACPHPYRWRACALPVSYHATHVSYACLSPHVPYALNAAGQTGEFSSLHADAVTGPFTEILSSRVTDESVLLLH